jgi:hypothetical protein
MVADIWISNFVMIPIIYIFYPETGSRSLEEIDMLFQSATEAGRPWFSVVKLSKTEPRWYDKDGLPTDSSRGEGSTTLAHSENGYGDKDKRWGANSSSGDDSN